VAKVETSNQDRTISLKAAVRSLIIITIIIIIIIITVKVTLEQARKTQKGSRGIALLFL